MSSGVCIFVCPSSLAEIVVREALKVLGERAKAVVLERLGESRPECLEGHSKVFLIDACSKNCAKETAEKLGLRYDVYINLEEELGASKCYENPDVSVVDDIGIAAARVVKEVEGALGN